MWALYLEQAEILVYRLKTELETEVQVESDKGNSESADLKY